MELYPFVYIAYAEPVGYLQIYIFVAEVGVQLVRISTPACIGHLHIEPVLIFPCPQKYGDTGVLPGNPVPDRILYERLQGEFGDKDLRIPCRIEFSTRGCRVNLGIKISVSGRSAEISRRISWRKRRV